MRCIAVVEAARPGLDSVIVWEDQGRLVAFAYLDGKVKMTRPLDALTIDDAVNEIRENFQITAGQFSRLTDWTDDAAVHIEPMTSGRKRW